MKTNKLFKDLSVLVVDDSLLILTTVKIMLGKFGVSESNIILAKSAKSALFHASQRTFNVVISDYNLGDDLNGRQFFQEITHHAYLKHDGVFMLISGDNSAATIQPIIELKPDGYLLKPFTQNDLEQRLTLALKRKQILAPFYHAQAKNRPQLGLEKCDELGPFNPKFYFDIEQFRATFLTQLEQYNEAKRVYETVLARKPLVWAQIGLANTLTAINEKDQAQQILQNVAQTMPNNSACRTELARFFLTQKQIDTALVHLTAASRLTPDNADRELALSHLYLSMQEFPSAINHYKAYLSLVKHTYRDTTHAQIQLARIMLFAYTSRSVDGLSLSQINVLLRAVNERKVSSVIHEIDLVRAHYAIARSDYRTAVSTLKRLAAHWPFSHFDTAYHFVVLTSYLNLGNPLDYLNGTHFPPLLAPSGTLLSATQMTMLDRLKQLHTEKSDWLEQQMSLLRTESGNSTEQLRRLVKIKNQHPLLRDASLRIVKLLSVVWPSGWGIFQVRKQLQECDLIVRQLYSVEELAEINYDFYYEKLLNICKSRK